MNQSSLFGNEEVQASIPGLIYQPEFLSIEEERELIAIIRTLPLHAAKYKQYLARRRVVSFGGLMTSIRTSCFLPVRLTSDCCRYGIALLRGKGCLLNRW